MLEQAPYFYEIADDIYEQLKDCIFVSSIVSSIEVKAWINGGISKSVRIIE
jgi:hypothetical protein